MSFVNTVDIVGDEALTTSIINRSITEIADNTVKKVGAAAFCGCSNLTTANFPAATIVDNQAFQECSKLTTADFPAATSIVTDAFCACPALTTINFPVATSIGENAFYGCANLTTADFPLVSSIGGNAFYSCSNLTTINFPVATSIGNHAFYTCSNLITADFPKVSSIGSHAFNYCSALTVANFPSATSVSSDSFSNCKALATINFQSATSIGGRAFVYCAFTTADFPMVTSIDRYAFNACSKLVALILRNTTAVCSLTGAIANTGNPIISGTGYIYVPRALLSDDDANKDYRRATNWSTYANQFRAIEDYTVDGTTTGEFDPNRCMVRFFNDDGTLLGYKVVPKGSNATWDGADPVKEGEWAFTGWKPEPVNIVADTDCYAQFKSTAFYYTKIIDRSIRGAYTNMVVTRTGNYAFAGSYYLTTADLPAVTSIGSYTFNGCRQLQTLILRSETMCTLTNSNGLPLSVEDGTGYIYVPRALLSDDDATKDYRRATNWSTYAAQFRAIEDYPDITGGVV